MSKILHTEIRALEKKLLVLSARIEEAVHHAAKAVETRDRGLAEEVIRDDDDIDRMEVEFEEEALKVLALHQPVAVDLRCIIALMKMNDDLERLGDLATTVAKQGLVLMQNPEKVPPCDLSGMAEKACAMIRTSVDAMVRLDAGLARAVRRTDKEMDALHAANSAAIRNAIRQDVDAVDSYLAYYLISRTLERMGDHAKNMADDVVYRIEGAIVRHSGGRPSGDGVPPKL